MFSRKYQYGAIVLLVLFFISSRVEAQTTNTALPDNVKIYATPGNYQVVITDKPGFETSVQTTCNNGQCTNSATATPLTPEQIKKMQDAEKAQEQQLEKLFQQQEAFFQAQQQYFQNFWNTMSF